MLLSCVLEIIKVSREVARAKITEELWTKLCTFGFTSIAAKIDSRRVIDSDLFGFSKVETILPQELILLKAINRSFWF
jgi:hypothetical protein